MMKSLDDRLASLARVAKDLNAVSDQISDSFRAVEDRLKTLGLGVEVQLERPLPLIGEMEEVSPDDDLEYEEVPTEEQAFLLQLDAELSGHAEEDSDVRGWKGRRCHLGYRKFAAAWRLVVVTYRCGWIRPADEGPIPADAEPQHIQELSVRPLLDCSRDIRLAAAGQIDDLLAAIESAAQERINRLQDSVAAGRKAVGVSEGAPKPVSLAHESATGAAKVRRKITSRTAR